MDYLKIFALISIIYFYNSCISNDTKSELDFKKNISNENICDLRLQNMESFKSNFCTALIIHDEQCHNDIGKNIENNFIRLTLFDIKKNTYIFKITFLRDCIIKVQKTISNGKFNTFSFLNDSEINYQVSKKILIDFPIDSFIIKSKKEFYSGLDQDFEERCYIIEFSKDQKYFILSQADSLSKNQKLVLNLLVENLDLLD